MEDLEADFDIPDEVKANFDAISNKVIELHLHLRYFKELFGGNPKRLKLMRDTAAQFFSIVQRTMINELVLGISNLTDPATMRKGDNLSISFLAGQLDGKFQLGSHFGDRAKAIVESATPFRIHRNRRVAHFDLTTVHTGDELLPDLSLELTEAVLVQIRSILNDAAELFGEGHTGYERVTTVIGGNTDSLIWHLIKSKLLDERIDPLDVWKYIEESEWKDALKARDSQQDT